VNNISIDVSPVSEPITRVGKAIENAATAALEEVSTLRTAVADFQRSAEEARKASVELASPELRNRLAALGVELEQLATATRTQRELTDAELLTLRSQVEAALGNARDVSSALDEIATVAMERLDSMRAPSDAGRSV
jgi:DNA anti-recombination protein RmuC